MSSRLNMLKAFRTHADVVGNQQYFVKRGVINYATHDWRKYPRTFAIMMDEGSLFEGVDIGLDSGQLTLELFTVIPDYRDDPMVDDGLLDELVSDVQTVIAEVLQTKDSQGDPVVLNISRQTARFTEAHDTTLGVQGIVATFEVSY